MAVSFHTAVYAIRISQRWQRRPSGLGLELQSFEGDRLSSTLRDNVSSSAGKTGKEYHLKSDSR